MRLLIVEDEERLAEAIAQGLRRQDYAVDIALDGQTGYDLAVVEDYDLVILDLTLPALDGLEVCRRLRRERPGLPMLMLTARSRPAERVLGLDQGADDYLVKPFHLSELVARIRALLRRTQVNRTPTLTVGPLWLDPAAHIATCAGRRLELTGKEFATLEYLLRQSGKVVSTEEILEHAWGRDTDRFSNTVRVHLTTLRRKLAAAGGEG